MSETELKSLLHERIESIHDIDFLEAVNKLLEEKHPEVASVEVPAFIMEILKESKNEIKEGKFRSHEEVVKDTERWLNE